MTKATAITFSLAILFSGIFGGARSAAPLVDVELEGVADGDTIYVRDFAHSTPLRIRLAMIDAPEKSQPYGSEARNTLSDLLRGTSKLTLETFGLDQYGRTIALVRDDRGRNINVAMVAQGAAWVFERFAQAPEYQSIYPEMSGAERNARAARLGLWTDPYPVEPWRYRQSH